MGHYDPGHIVFMRMFNTILLGRNGKLFVFPFTYCSSDVFVQMLCSNQILYLLLILWVMWIRIDCMRIRIHKVWWLRIQVNKITNLMSIQLFNVKKKKNYFQICTLNISLATFIGSDLNMYNLLWKKSVCLTLLFP